MHDTVEFEKRGVPATVVITEAFRKAAEFQFRGRGLPGHGYIELPHPVSSLASDEVRALALARVDDVVRALTSASPGRWNP